MRRAGELEAPAALTLREVDSHKLHDGSRQPPVEKGELPAGAQQASAQPHAREGTAPDPDDREAELNEAMRGLRYDGLRLSTDERLAAEIVPSPSAEQSQTEQAAGRRAMEERRFINAVAALTRAVLNDPGNDSALESLAWALEKAGRPREASIVQRSVIEANPGEARLHEAQALFAQSAGDFVCAADAWRTVTTLDPRHATARGRLAVLLYFSEDYTGAWETIHAAEAAGQTVPPQLRPLLEERSPEAPQ
ncbi:MAG: hypothetical protein HZB38_11920 [Planctomycetes bacterium]|nr:hypothetical protein [Planctomycetota bacterium]